MESLHGQFPLEIEIQKTKGRALLKKKKKSFFTLPYPIVFRYSALKDESKFDGIVYNHQCHHLPWTPPIFTECIISMDSHF